MPLPAHFLKAALPTALLLLAFVCHTQTRSDFSNPIRITHRQGLPDNRVLCMAQDGDGFLWFGTYDGLCRFDGTVVEVFKNDPNDPATISNNQIQSLIYEKTANLLWIGTKNGLNVLDLCTGEFKTYFHQPGDPCSIPEDEIGKAIFKDRQGMLWIASGTKGFMRYNPRSDDFDCFAYPFSTLDTGERLERVNHVDQIAQDLRNDSILWVGTSAGLLRFNKLSGKFKRYYADLGDKQTNIRANSIYSMYLHPDGKLYLGTWGNYLMVFDPGKASFQKLTATLDTQRFPEGHGVVYEIVKKSERELWVTTNHGLCIFDVGRSVFTSELLNDPATETVYWVSFQDDKGRLWGRSGSGIRIYDPLNTQFTLFPLDKDMNEGFSIQDAIEAPGKGKLYVSIAGGKGLYLLDRATGSWTLLPPPPDFFKTSLKFYGHALRWLQDGRLLVVEENALFTLSSDGKSLVPFPLQPGGKGVRYFEALQDRKGRIWIGSVDGGLFRLDLRKGTSTVFKDELLPENEKGTSLAIGDIFEDKRDNIWIDVRDGMSIYDNRNDRFINHFYQPGKTTIFKHVGGFEEDLEGNVLIAGSREEGIGVADPDHPELGIQRILQINDNPSFYANGLVKDRSGNLWMDGEKKLLKLDLRTLELNSFDGHDGLAYLGDDIETVHFSSHSLLGSGEMFLGYSNGLSVGIFHPDSLKQNRELPRPYLHSFAVFDEELDQGAMLINCQKITLPYSQNFFSFEFSAIGFSRPQSIRFKYKLEGIDPDWVYPAEGRRYASYSNVREGKYMLRIAAANNEFIWNEATFNFPIVVLPPWYRTWLAYLIYSGIFVVLAWGVYKQLKQRWALKMELQMEHREAERLKELDAVKTRLYTNITHEFRTPLTIISGMADQIMEQPKELLEEGVSMVKRNSQYLLCLVNQMLDLRKIESGNMALDMQNGDVLPFLRYLLESFHSIASAKNIELRFETDLDTLVMDYDPDKFQKIVSNLLSNALKFTPEGGQVLLHADFRNLQDFGNLLLMVTDTGIGIPTEKLPFIFDPFYQANDTHTRPGEGTGIGLALTRELVKLLGGTIGVESEIGKGSVFTVELPLTNHVEKKRANDGLAVCNEEIAPDLSAGSCSTVLGRDASLPKAPTVLLIEDNADVVTYLKTCLQGSYHLLIATDGKAGMERAIESIPDLILSDVMMPKMDGFEVCKTLKNDERTSHIPIILLTAKADMESRLEGLDCGADAYLPKPFEPRELFLSLRNLLELHKKMQSHYLALAVGHPAKSAEPQQTGQAEKRENAFVQKTRDIVEQHLDDALFSTEDMGKLLAMSRSQLHRKLTALTGLSPNHFMRIVKLDKARHFLVETDMSIAEIAYRTGFSDPGYFSRVFRQEYGMTPKEWRDGKGLRCK